MNLDLVFAIQASLKNSDLLDYWYQWR